MPDAERHRLTCTTIISDGKECGGVVRRGVFCEVCREKYVQPETPADRAKFFRNALGAARR